jgi:phosphate uptake regulator
MPAKETRKLNKMGPSSVGITLPKPYLDYHKLKPADLVQVIYDGLILIVPLGAEKKVREREELVRRLLE